MKIIAASLVLLCSALCGSAQETPSASSLNEKRVALTEAQVTPIVVTENWFEELKKVVGK